MDYDKLNILTYWAFTFILMGVGLFTLGIWNTLGATILWLIVSAIVVGLKELNN